MKRLKITEIQIFAIDMNRAKEFYSKTLALPIKSESPSMLVLDTTGGDDKAALLGATVDLVILAGARDKKAQKGFGTTADVSICFEVDSIAEWRKRLESRGVFFFSEINEFPNRKYCAFMDPEGNLIELVERTGF